MEIRAATARDLPVLQAIERAAGLAYRDVGMDEIAAAEPLGLDELARYQQDGRAWVAVDDADRPVGYLIADTVNGNLHVEQVSMHPGRARRGVGRRLIGHLAARATGAVSALTLTTFTEVPWNEPYYRRCGFRTLGANELTPGLLAIRRREAAHGLDRWPRVCMRRDLTSLAAAAPSAPGAAAP